MNAEEKRRIIRGEVFCEGRWVPIDKKYEIEQQRRKKIEAGYVFYQGEWISIDEKCARVLPPKPKEEKKSETIVINQYDNRTVYNVDKRTTHHHEHRHVNIDKDGLEEYIRNRLPEGNSEMVELIDEEKNNVSALPGKKKKNAIPDRRKIKGFLKAPEDD